MISTVALLVSITFVAMMSPGPDMFLILRYGSSSSRLGAACVGGIATGIACHVAFALVGLSVVIQNSVLLYTLIRYLGAAYLIYVGCKTFFSSSTSQSLQVNVGSFPKDRDLAKAFREGLFCNLLNPKVTLFILSLFTQVVSPSIHSSQKALLGLLLVTEVLLVWLSFLWIIQRKVVQHYLARCESVINKIAGSILVVFGGLVFANSTR